jgi:hypothetical protein
MLFEAKVNDIMQERKKKSGSVNKPLMLIHRFEVKEPKTHIFIPRE